MTLESILFRGPENGNLEGDPFTGFAICLCFNKPIQTYIVKIIPVHINLFLMFFSKIKMSGGSTKKRGEKCIVALIQLFIILLIAAPSN